MTAKLRLAYLVPEFPGQTHVFFWREVCALRESGDEVLLLSTRRPAPITCRHEFAHAAVRETHYLFPPSFRSIMRWALRGCRGLDAARRYLRQLQRKTWGARARHFLLLAAAIDLIEWARVQGIAHVHGHSCGDAAHTLALARALGGPPYSLTLHGDMEVYGEDHDAKMQGATFVATVGDHLRAQVLRSTRVPASRVHTTCMGLDTRVLASLGGSRVKQSHPLHVITVARLNFTKGHAHALAAVRRAIEAGLSLRYTIAGEGPYRAELVALIERFGLRDHVRLTGTLSESEVFQLLDEADVFLLPSIGSGEAWPVSVMEAMAAGLPVVSSVIGATPQMITDGVDGFLVPQADDAAIFGRIAALAASPQLRERMGAAARRTAQSRFDVRGTAARLRQACARGELDSRLTA